MNELEKDDFKDQVWKIIHSIPIGKVATYGQIARLADHPAHARLVGRILANLPTASQLPWHRVVNGQGRLTCPGKDRQEEKLAAEGVILINGKVNLRRYQWPV
jgi:methylated-DNA-protein-cysteine methyltransferase-like protein